VIDTVVMMRSRQPVRVNFDAITHGGDAPEAARTGDRRATRRRSRGGVATGAGTVGRSSTRDETGRRRANGARHGV